MLVLQEDDKMGTQHELITQDPGVFWHQMNHFTQNCDFLLYEEFTERGGK